MSISAKCIDTISVAGSCTSKKAADSKKKSSLKLSWYIYITTSVQNLICFLCYLDTYYTFLSKIFCFLFFNWFLFFSGTDFFFLGWLYYYWYCHYSSLWLFNLLFTCHLKGTEIIIFSECAVNIVLVFSALCGKLTFSLSLTLPREPCVISPSSTTGYQYSNCVHLISIVSYVEAIKTNGKSGVTFTSRVILTEQFSFWIHMTRRSTPLLPSCLHNSTLHCNHSKDLQWWFCLTETSHGTGIRRVRYTL